MAILSPSILAADFNVLGSELAKISDAGCKWVHIDVMDGAFVPSISFGMPLITSIRKNSSLFFDTHLMVNEPVRYVEDFKKAGADLLTIHVEACKDVIGTINAIKAAGMKVGISLNPETDVNLVLPYVKEVDLVLVMSVHPGFGGQKFIPETLIKAKAIRNEIDKVNPTCRLEMDGGINLSNAAAVMEAGIDTIVAGTAVFGGDAFANVKAFKDICKSIDR